MPSLSGQTLSLRSNGLLAESLFSSQLKLLRARTLLSQPVSVWTKLCISDYIMAIGQHVG